MNREAAEAALAELPLYACFWIDPRELAFSDRVRQICRQECAMYGASWSCPPGVGTVEGCRSRCLGYDSCLVSATVTETEDISDMPRTLTAEPEHERITEQAAQVLRSMGAQVHILSAHACTLCDRCTYSDGQPCRFPERMHPCVESYGINVIPLLERCGEDLRWGGKQVLWVSLLLCRENEPSSTILPKMRKI